MLYIHSANPCHPVRNAASVTFLPSSSEQLQLAAPPAYVSANTFAVLSCDADASSAYINAISSALVSFSCALSLARLFSFIGPTPAARRRTGPTS